MQRFTYVRGSEEVTLSLPSSKSEVIAGVHWGEPCAFFTPAYWYTQYVMRAEVEDQNRHPVRYRIGETFAEEIAACLLGGYGIPAEIGNAAFKRLKSEGLICELCDDPSILEKILHEPLQVGRRQVRYRFWRKKALYLAAVFHRLRSIEFPMRDAIELRNNLMNLPGIGPKTASWTVRNWTSSDDIAILDIHIVRAGVLMNLYGQHDDVEKHYLAMEKKFVTLANKMTIPTAALDALIWSMMRSTPRLVAAVMINVKSRVRPPQA